MSDDKLTPLVKQASDCFQKRKYKEAAKKYTKLLEADPENSYRWLCSRGECHLHLGKTNKAQEDGKNAKLANEKSVEAYVLLGKVAAKQAEFIDSLNHFKEGLNIDPNNTVISEELKKLQTVILEDQRLKSGDTDSTYSAVALCSQSCYPGDDQLIKMEREILEIKYHILEDEFYQLNGQITAPKKDAELEARMVQAAYECLSCERFEEALALVSKAISMDPANSFYRCFRAQVYFNMKQWARVIQDYWVIPKSQRKPDVWKQGGKAFVELWLPVHAEFWFRKACQTSKEPDEESSIAFQNVRVKRLYDPLTRDQAVRVDFSQFGRVVFAKEDIAKGETVMIDIPMVLAQSLTSKDVPACFNCAVSLISPEIYFQNNLLALDEPQKDLIKEFWPNVDYQWCPHCEREIYCNKFCREEAWDTYHKVICPHFNAEAKQLYDLCKNDGFGYSDDGEWLELWTGHFSPMILAKIWAIIISQVQKLIETEGVKEPTTEHWARAKAPFRRFIAFGTVPAVKRMPHMLPIFQSVFNVCNGGIGYNITADDFNGRYYQAACNLQCFSPSITPYHKFMDNIKEDERAIGIIKFLTNRPPEAQFAGMFPLHACTNHSCYNNSEVCDVEIHGKTGVQMIARRDIKKDEEIFITYIDTTLPKLLRKAWLFKSFNFWCQCQRCEFEGEHPDECTHCHKKAAEGKKFAACGNCKRAWYCGTECQRASWKRGHKTICTSGHSQARQLV